VGLRGRPPRTACNLENPMHRREILKLAALSAAAVALDQRSAALEPPLATGPIPIIDAHIHLFDTLRPGYAALSTPFGVVGAIAIEASPLLSDNQWLLNVAADNPLIVGIIGDLVPGSATFQQDLDRLHGDQLFLGIRYGNLWNRDLSVDLEAPGFIEGLKALARAGLVFETANPDPRLIAAIVEVAERVPDLRIVIDHLPHAPIPTEKDAQDEYWSNLRLLAQSPRVFVKLSEIPVLANKKLVTDPRVYQASVDILWNMFGEDHVLFGSDWPNSDNVATYAQTFSIVRSYMARKTYGAREKYFWKNSLAAYRWTKRKTDQPSA
jgi:predicted TIM-barrel fold metal-dependent hydrolase